MADGKISGKPPVVGASLLVAGNIVGAGILGLPITTGLAGFTLSTAAMLVMWVMMVATAVIIGMRVLEEKREDLDLPTLFGNSLGAGGRWGAVGANLLILYGLLVAYLCGGTSMFVNLFHPPVPGWVVTLGFFAALSGFTLLGPLVVQKGNGLLMVLMWAAFAALIALAAPRMEAHRLTYVDWNFLPLALPIMVTSFHFHNIVPTICRTVDFQAGALKKALALGAFLGLVMNLAWCLVVMGVLDPKEGGSLSLLYDFREQLPATVPLSALLHSQFFTTAGMAFALLAIATSYLANGTALMSFVRDMTGGGGKGKNILNAALAFGPPLLVSVFYPSLFLSALNVVGGVGIALLFGVFPGLLAYQRAASARGRLAALVLITAFALVLVFEVMQETGFLELDPDVESWTCVL